MAELPRRVSWEVALQSGARQIREEGIAHLDLDEIAAFLNVSPDAVRYWFSDETELLLSVMQLRQGWFLEEANSRMAPEPSYTGKLRALIDLCVADHDMSYSIELWKLGLRDERARQGRQTLAGPFRDLFARVIRAGQRNGEFASVSPDQVALVLVGMVVGLAVEVTVGEDTQADAMHAVLVGACERLLEVELA